MFETHKIALADAERRMNVIEAELLRQMQRSLASRDNAHLSSLFDKLQAAIAQCRVMKADVPSADQTLGGGAQCTAGM